MRSRREEWCTGGWVEGLAQKVKCRGAGRSGGAWSVGWVGEVGGGLMRVEIRF